MSAPAPEQDRAALARDRAAAQGRIRWELLTALVRKDLKVKYQGSVLGFVWSLANPLFMLGIYYVIFTYVFDAGVPSYHVYLMAGLLAFTAFSQGVGNASTSVVGNAGLVKKVRFPLAVLPLSGVGFAMVQLALQLPVLLVIALVSGINFFGLQFLLIVPALTLLVVLTVALGTIASALNVRYRDTSHFVEIFMLVWFWTNPILYRVGLVKEQLGDLFWVYFLNPTATIVATVQRAVYVEAYPVGDDGTPVQVLADSGYAFYFRNLAIGFAVSLALLWFARRVFRKYQADFAEDL